MSFLNFNAKSSLRIETSLTGILRVFFTQGSISCNLQSNTAAVESGGNRDYLVGRGGIRKHEAWVYPSLSLFALSNMCHY